MRKDESRVSCWWKHTRKRLGMRRIVNKGVRRNVKPQLREELEMQQDDYEQDVDEYAHLDRLCQRCNSPVPCDWDYAWCEDCTKKECTHGNTPGECNECLMQDDIDFDTARERRSF